MANIRSDFGAVGDGHHDDTAAFKRAIATLPGGATLSLDQGSFLISESLVFEKPIRIIGTTREQSKIIFSPSGSYVQNGLNERVGFWFLHDSTTVPEHGGDARRSILSGLTLVGAATLSNMSGLLISAPIYCYELSVEQFGGDGISILAAQTGDAEALAGMPVGNANGSSFINCEALRNGRHGFHLRGNNANACVLLGCRSPSNGAWGFCDDSLLGNSYLGCEADSNDEGGYYSNPDKPIRSTYLGCYSETETHFSIGALCTIAGSQGLYKPGRASGGIGLSGLPIGAAYLTQQLVIAASDDVANALGHAPYAGKMIAVGDEGIVYRATAASPYVKLNGVLSANYTDFLNDDHPVIRFPNSAFTGNISPKRPHLQEGFTTGGSGKSGIVGAGSNPPGSGTYDQGAIWLNDSPIAGGNIGWVCVVDGTNTAWKAFGAIEE